MKVLLYCPGGTIPPRPPLLTGGLPAPLYPPGDRR